VSSSTTPAVAAISSRSLGAESGDRGAGRFIVPSAEKSSDGEG
jgi:hypothetical protein